MSSLFNIFENIPGIGEVLEKWQKMYARDEDAEPVHLGASNSEEFKEVLEALDSFTYSDGPHVMIGMVELFQDVLQFFNFLHRYEVDLRHIRACLFACRGFSTNFLEGDSIHEYIQKTIHLIGKPSKETFEYIVDKDPEFKDFIMEMYQMGDAIIRDYWNHKEDCPCGGPHTWSEDKQNCIRCMREHPNREKEQESDDV